MAGGTTCLPAPGPPLRENLDTGTVCPLGFYGDAIAVVICVIGHWKPTLVPRLLPGVGLPHSFLLPAISNKKTPISLKVPRSPGAVCQGHTSSDCARTLELLFTAHTASNLPFPSLVAPQSRRPPQVP